MRRRETGAPPGYVITDASHGAAEPIGNGGGARGWVVQAFMYDAAVRRPTRQAQPFAEEAKQGDAHEHNRAGGFPGELAGRSGDGMRWVTQRRRGACALRRGTA